MSDTYAVVQTTLELPDVEQLKRAFTGLKKLTPADAHILGRDAFGVLVKNLEAEDATQLQGALRSQGIETELVAMDALPAMPPGKFVHRLDCLPDALMIYDPLGRSFPIEWWHVMIVAAGNVRVMEFNQIPTRRTVIRYQSGFSGSGVPVPEVETDYSTKEQFVFKPLLEIILAGGVQRFQIEGGKMLFNYLGARRQKGEAENFTLLVRDLLQFAPHALPNRGAFFLKQEPPQLFSYPSKNAFFEEIVWMLWKARGKG